MDSTPRRSRLSFVHLLAGVVFVVVFLATGRYMRTHFPELYQNDETMRMLFRSGHIYILFSALLNLGLSAYLSKRKGWRGILQYLASLAILAAPVVLTAAFFWEPAPGRLERPMSLFGLILASVGTIGHGVAGWSLRRTGQGDRSSTG